MVLIGGGAIVLVLAVVFAIRFESAWEQDATPPARTSPQETHKEPAPVRHPRLGKRSRRTKASLTIPEPKPPQRLRVPQEVSRETFTSAKVLPVYPPLARQAHVQGTVILNADISKDGAVESLKEVSGHPMLIPAAIDAVKQWRYKPYLLNGEPVAMTTQVVVNFTLSIR